MSVTDPQGRPVDRERPPDNALWHLLRKRLSVRGDRQKWRVMAALSLREICGWDLEPIGEALGWHKGRVLRHIQRAKRELRAALLADDLVHLIDDDPDDSAAVDAGNDAGG